MNTNSIKTCNAIVAMLWFISVFIIVLDNNLTQWHSRIRPGCGHPEKYLARAICKRRLYILSLYFGTSITFFRSPQTWDSTTLGLKTSVLLPLWLTLSSLFHLFHLTSEACTVVPVTALNSDVAVYWNTHECISTSLQEGEKMDISKNKNFRCGYVSFSKTWWKHLCLLRKCSLWPFFQFVRNAFVCKCFMLSCQ